MVERADIVVIGSGGFGAATAFHLVERGARNVVVVDKHDLASQTSPRAAGLVSHARTTDLMIELVKVASAKFECFADATGQPLDWTRSGSLEIARRPEDVPVVEREVARGARLGLDVEQVSAEDAHRLNPFLQPNGVLAVMYVGDAQPTLRHRASRGRANRIRGCSTSTRSARISRSRTLRSTRRSFGGWRSTYGGSSRFSSRPRHVSTAAGYRR